MEKREIIKRRFIFMADYGKAWGWQTNYYDDGFIACDGCIADVLTETIWCDKGSAKISPALRRAINKWQIHFEQYATDDYDYASRKERELTDTFDWDGWNKVGIRLAYLVKKQIGHLFDEFYYDYPCEDKDFKKVWRRTKGVEIK